MLTVIKGLNKAEAILIGCLIASLAGVFVSFGVYSSSKTRYERAKSRLAQMTSLRDELQPVRQRVASLESRKGLTKAQGIVDAVGKVIEPLGLKAKVKSIKPVGVKEASEERAEVAIEKVSMNEMVNILYAVENAPMLFIIRKTTVSTSFENPELLNVTITLSLVT